jgi:hypothetical protein
MQTRIVAGAIVYGGRVAPPATLPRSSTPNYDYLRFRPLNGADVGFVGRFISSVQVRLLRIF